MNFRIIFSDNGVLSDLSVALDNYHSQTAVIPFVSAEDYIFIGSRFPFNSFYAKFASLNVLSSTISISIWDGNQWRATVDVIDQTSGFQSDGYISFVPNKNQSGWNQDDTVLNNGSERVIGLGDITIYDQYWLRIGFSADLTATTELSWLGHLFCSDEDIYSEYPIFNSTSLKTAFESGKTNWEEQRAFSSKLVIEDMIHRNLIIDKGQILDVSKLRSATISKTAQMIFNALGDDYRDDTKLALSDYESRIKGGVFNLDLNNNAILDDKEASFTQGYLTR